MLLPQEVKELGRDQEIVLYEGLRPILCRKNRYFQDPVFRKRLFPPPAHATPGGPPPAPPAPQASAVDAQLPVEPEGKFRPSTVEDIERIDELTLEDFETDLSRIHLPSPAQGGELSKDELDAAVEKFLAAF